MRKTLLSTAEVANLFNITETTVKRWADEGRLRCQKTPGGHRKFPMKEVIDFAEKYGFTPTGTLTLPKQDALSTTLEVAVLSRDFDRMVDVFVEKALAPDPSDLGSFLSYLYQHHIYLWEIFDRVLRPGMVEVGKRWKSGAITVGHEHRCSYETLEALAQLKAQVLTRPLTDLSALCACPGDEEHHIGLRSVANTLESEGWSVLYLGARTPVESIERLCDEYRPSLICLSLASADIPRTLLSGIRRLRHMSKRRRSRIVIGGSLLQKGDFGEEECDAMLFAIEELLRYARAFFRPVPGKKGVKGATG